MSWKTSPLEGQIFEVAARHEPLTQTSLEAVHARADAARAGKIGAFPSARRDPDGEAAPRA
jgi:hypothetical protein